MFTPANERGLATTPDPQTKRAASQSLVIKNSTPTINKTLALRDYQRECLEAVVAARGRGVRRQLVALPTGTGKTVVFAHKIAESPGRSLVLVHRDELIIQTADKLRHLGLSNEMGIVKAEQDDHAARVVLASVQTVTQEHRLSRLVPDFDLVVVDEAHHAAAPSYRGVLEYLGAFSEHGPLLLGFTATPERGDGVGLHEIFEEIVYRRDLLEMIQAGYLCDLRAKQVRLLADYGELHTRAGDFIPSELDRMLLDAKAPAHAARAYVEHAAGRKGLVFTPTIKTAHAMAGAFREAGVAAEALDAGTDHAERRAMLARLRSGETQVVCNCAVLTEGFDEPSLECIVIARPTRSRPFYIQMLGRGMRTWPGKDDCLILDLVGASTRHDLVTAASLFGISPKQLEDQTLVEAKAEQAAAARRKAEEVVASGQLVVQPVDLFARRRLHWVQAGSVWVLSIADGMIRLEPDGETWRVIRETRDSGRLTLASGLDLGYAQGLAEDEVRRLGQAYLANPHAPWRVRPASEKQLLALPRFGIPIVPGMTAGAASDAITAALASGRRRW